MNDRTPIALLFAGIFLLAAPAVVHSAYEGAYRPERLGGTFWIGPISTTVPYFCLTLLFLAHCFDLKSNSHRTAYWGAILAWLSMMAFTIYLISQPPGPKLSSTMGIAVGLTPFFYLPLLVVPYIVGVIASKLWAKHCGP